jgi:hypothetical protein
MAEAAAPRNRVGNPGYKDTKSAFADYAAAMER